MCAKISLAVSLLFQTSVLAQDPTPPESPRIEIHHIEEVLPLIQEQINKHGAEHVWVVWDVDHTLLKMKTQLGTEQWFRWQVGMIKSGEKSPYKVAETIEEFHELNFKVMNFLSMLPVESTTASTFNRIQDLGVSMFGFTARPTRYREMTIRELQNNSLMFRTLLAQHPNIEDVAARLNTTDQEVTIQNGLVMTSHTEVDKAALLQKLVEIAREDIRVECLILIDDSIRTNDRMRKASNWQLDVLPILYTNDHESIENFPDPQKAATFNEFMRHLEKIKELESSEKKWKPTEIFRFYFRNNKSGDLQPELGAKKLLILDMIKKNPVEGGPTWEEITSAFESAGLPLIWLENRLMLANNLGNGALKTAIEKYNRVQTDKNQRIVDLITLGKYGPQAGIYKDQLNPDEYQKAVKRTGLPEKFVPAPEEKLIVFERTVDGVFKLYEFNNKKDPENASLSIEEIKKTCLQITGEPWEEISKIIDTPLKEVQLVNRLLTVGEMPLPSLIRAGALAYNKICVAGQEILDWTTYEQYHALAGLPKTSTAKESEGRNQRGSDEKINFPLLLAEHKKNSKRIVVDAKKSGAKLAPGQTAPKPEEVVSDTEALARYQAEQAVTLERNTGVAWTEESFKSKVKKWNELTDYFHELAKPKTEMKKRIWAEMLAVWNLPPDSKVLDQIKGTYIGVKSSRVVFGILYKDFFKKFGNQLNLPSGEVVSKWKLVENEGTSPLRKYDTVGFLVGAMESEVGLSLNNETKATEWLIKIGEYLKWIEQDQERKKAWENLLDAIGLKSPVNILDPNTQRLLLYIVYLNELPENNPKYIDKYQTALRYKIRQIFPKARVVGTEDSFLQIFLKATVLGLFDPKNSSPRVLSAKKAGATPVPGQVSPPPEEILSNEEALARWIDEQSKQMPADPKEADIDDKALAPLDPAQRIVDPAGTMTDQQKAAHARPLVYNGALSHTPLPTPPYFLARERETELGAIIRARTGEDLAMPYEEREIIKVELESGRDYVKRVIVKHNAKFPHRIDWQIYSLIDYRTMRTVFTDLPDMEIFNFNDEDLRYIFDDNGKIPPNRRKVNYASSDTRFDLSIDELREYKTFFLQVLEEKGTQDVGNILDFMRYSVSNSPKWSWSTAYGQFRKIKLDVRWLLSKPGSNLELFYETIAKVNVWNVNQSSNETMMDFSNWDLIKDAAGITYSRNEFEKLAKSVGFEEFSPQQRSNKRMQTLRIQKGLLWYHNQGLPESQRIKKFSKLDAAGIPGLRHSAGLLQILSQLHLETRWFFTEAGSPEELAIENQPIWIGKKKKNASDLSNQSKVANMSKPRAVPVSPEQQIEYDLEEAIKTNTPPVVKTPLDFVVLLMYHNHQHPEDKIYSLIHFKDAAKKYGYTKYESIYNRLHRNLDVEASIDQALGNDEYDLLIRKIIAEVGKPTFTKPTNIQAYHAEIEANAAMNDALTAIGEQLDGIDIRDTSNPVVRKFYLYALYIHLLDKSDVRVRDMHLIAFRRLLVKHFLPYIKDIKAFEAAILHGYSPDVMLFGKAFQNIEKYVFTTPWGRLKDAVSRSLEVAFGSALDYIRSTQSIPSSQPSTTQNLIEDTSIKNPIEKLAWKLVYGAPLDLSNPEHRTLLSIYISNYFRGSQTSDIAARLKEVEKFNSLFPELFNDQIQFNSISMDIEDVVFHSDATLEKIYENYNNRARVIYERNFGADVWKNIEDPNALLREVHQNLMRNHQNIPPQLDSFMANRALHELLWDELGRVVVGRLKNIEDAEARKPLENFLRYIEQTYAFSMQVFHSNYSRADGKGKVEQLMYAVQDAPREFRHEVLGTDPYSQGNQLFQNTVTESGLQTLRSINMSLKEKERKTRNIMIRQLHGYEIPFMGNLGYHCTVEKSFALYNTKSYALFTLTMPDGVSKGTLTVMLGTATVDGVEKNVGIIEQIDNIDRDMLFSVLEATRRIFDQNGYELLFPERLYGGMASPLSNDTETVDMVRESEIYKNGKKFEGFKPLTGKFEFSHSGARLNEANMNGMKIEPIQLDEKTKINVMSRESASEFSFDIAEIRAEMVRLRESNDMKNVRAYFKAMRVLGKFDEFKVEAQKANHVAMSFSSQSTSIAESQAMLQYAFSGSPNENLLREMFVQAARLYETEKNSKGMVEWMQFYSNQLQVQGSANKIFNRILGENILFFLNHNKDPLKLRWGKQVLKQSVLSESFESLAEHGDLETLKAIVSKCEKEKIEIHYLIIQQGIIGAAKSGRLDILRFMVELPGDEEDRCMRLNVLDSASEIAGERGYVQIIDELLLLGEKFDQIPPIVRHKGSFQGDSARLKVIGYGIDGAINGGHFDILAKLAMAPTTEDYRMDHDHEFNFGSYLGGFIDLVRKNNLKQVKKFLETIERVNIQLGEFTLGDAFKVATENGNPNIMMDILDYCEKHEIDWIGSADVALGLQVLAKNNRLDLFDRYMEVTKISSIEWSVWWLAPSLREANRYRYKAFAEKLLNFAKSHGVSLLQWELIGELQEIALKGTVKQGRDFYHKNKNVKFNQVILNSALVISAESEHWDFVECLLKMGADAGGEGQYGMLVMEHIEKDTHQKKLEALAEKVSSEGNIASHEVKQGSILLDYAERIRQRMESAWKSLRNQWDGGAMPPIVENKTAEPENRGRPLEDPEVEAGRRAYEAGQEIDEALNGDDLKERLLDLALRMNALLKQDNGKAKLKSIRNPANFKTIIEYFQARAWRMSSIDQATLKAFLKDQQKLDQQGNDQAREIMAIELTMQLADALAKDATGKTISEEFEQIKHLKAQRGDVFERIEQNIIKMSGRYQGAGKMAGNFTANTFRETWKFMLALGANLLIDACLKPTITMEDFINLGLNTHNHAWGLVTFGFGASSGSAFSKMVGDRIFANSLEGLQYQLKNTMIRKSGAYALASAQVGFRTYIRSQIGFIVGSLVNGFLHDDYNDPEFWNRQIKGIASFMMAGAITRGGVFTIGKILEGRHIIKAGSAVAALHPAALIWQTVYLTADLFLSPRLLAEYEKSVLQAKLEPEMSQAYRDYLAVLTDRKETAMGCNQSNKQLVLECIQMSLIRGIQQNWQYITQFELNAEAQQHMTQFLEWEKAPLASGTIASFDNMYETYEHSMDAVNTPSTVLFGGYASRKLYQYWQTQMPTTPWKNLKQLKGEAIRVLLPKDDEVERMVQGAQYFTELDALNSDYTRDMVAMFREFGEEILDENSKIAARYYRIRDVQNKAKKALEQYKDLSPDEAEPCHQEVEDAYNKDLAALLESDNRQINLDQFRVLQTKRKSNPFALPFGMFREKMWFEEIPALTLEGRVSAASMLDLIYLMAQIFHAVNPDESRDAVSLLMMLHQELIDDIKKHIHIKDKNPYLEQHPFANAHMLETFMPFGYDHEHKKMNGNDYLNWSQSSKRKYMLLLPSNYKNNVQDYIYARVVVDEMVERGMIQLKFKRSDALYEKAIHAAQTYLMWTLGHNVEDFRELLTIDQMISEESLDVLSKVTKRYVQMGAMFLSQYECEGVEDLYRREQPVTMKDRADACPNSKSIGVQILYQPAPNASKKDLYNMNSKVRNSHEWARRYQTQLGYSFMAPLGQVFIHDQYMNELLQ